MMYLLDHKVLHIDQLVIERVSMTANWHDFKEKIMLSLTFDFILLQWPVE